MGFDMEYTIGGRKVSKREWEKHLFEDTPRNLAKQTVEERLRGLRCPTHGETPTLSNMRDTSQGWDFTISACCDEHLARAQHAAAGG
jgi:hypothetical protein